MISAGMHGAATWVDLSTSDIDGAVAFYPELLGWDDVEKSDTPTGLYHIGKVGDHQVGGMMQHESDLEGMPPTWTIFFYADNIEATVERVAELGGSVLTPPFDIPEARIAVVTDPTGGMFGLFAGPEINGEFYSMTSGAVGWVELQTRDTAAAEAFYRGLFGWEADTADVAATPYTTFTLGGEMAAGMMPMPPNVPAEVPAYWGIYFVVSDCATVEAHAKDLGGSVLVPTMSVPSGKFAVLTDPAGAGFSIMEYAT